MKKAKIKQDEIEQITFDSLMDEETYASGDDLLNDIQLLLDKQQAQKVHDDAKPKKRGRKALPRHVKGKEHQTRDNASEVQQSADPQVRDAQEDNAKADTQACVTSDSNQSDLSQANNEIYQSQDNEQASQTKADEITENQPNGDQEVNADKANFAQSATPISDNQETVQPQENGQENGQIDAAEQQQAQQQSQETDSNTDDVSEQAQKQEAASESGTDPDGKSDAQQDVEQEKLLRQQRVAMFTKPDILLETPYTITVGKKQFTRYRLEFGRPDATIPPEISASAGNYISKIDEADEKLIKKKKRNIRQKNVLRSIGGWMISLASAVLIAFLLYSFVFIFAKVDGPSMLDTLHDQNYMFVWRLGYRLGTPQRGDVVICHYPDHEGNYDSVNYVKRVVGLPGETISMKNGYVYVDGRMLEESYITPLRRGSHNMDPIVLGADQYFLMGDNRVNSMDSRDVGPIKKDQIIGKAVQKLLPIKEFSTIK